MRKVLPYLALGLLVLVVFRELAFTDRILGRGDTFAYFYPYWTARDAFFRAGELPLWTPNIFMGAPLLANPQIGALYPPNWLTIGLDAPNAIRVSILLHVVWSTLGAYLLVRRAVRLSVNGALVTAAVFGLGGYVGAHVEQINQLQGLAWFPWLFLLLHRSIAGVGVWRAMPLRPILLLGGAIALQILSGHTQTVFISGVGLVLYGFASMKPLRTVAVLAGAGMIALVLASPQLIPTFELVGQSSRSGGLDAQAALSFSLHPLVAGQGLLPSYEAKLFTEYVGYVGVVGLVLAVVGVMRPHPPTPSGRERTFSRRVWVVIVLAGLFLALGAYNPLNWLIVQVPGFDLFRVPARWLALYGLGMAVLAGIGTDALLAQYHKKSGDEAWRTMLQFGVPVGLVVMLAGASFLAGFAPEDIDGAAPPGMVTLAGWSVALAAVIGVMVAPGRWCWLALPLVGVELVAASWVMPYNDLVPPDVWSAQRFTISQMLAYTETDENGLTTEGTPPGRVLSISGLLFDPGDKAALSVRYAALGMTPLEERYAFVAAKMKETLSPNLSLAWGIPSVDGYDGGLLPTKHYNTFMELVYPDGVDVPGDGRLRENLALEDCRGACVPYFKWLLMMDASYLLTDKVFDIWHEGIAFDTTFKTEQAVWGTRENFPATDIFVIYSCKVQINCTVPTIEYRGEILESANVPTFAEDSSQLLLSRFELDAPDIMCCVDFDPSFNANVIHAVTIANSATGNFVQLESDTRWMTYSRRLSSDIKLYSGHRQLRVMQQPDVVILEDELDIDRFHPDRTIEIYLSDVDSIDLPEGVVPTRIPQITRYHPTRVDVETKGAGMLILYDSYYPGWQASVNGEPAPIYRANINFRAVPLPAGESHVIFEYAPWWLPGVFVFGGLAWTLAGFMLSFTFWRKRK